MIQNRAGVLQQRTHIFREMAGAGGDFLASRAMPLQPPNSLEVKSDPRFEISDLDYLHINVHIAYMVCTLLAASEAAKASKQPWR